MPYSYDPPPGPKTPERYPKAPGPNYQKYGEQPGKIYDPYADKYFDPSPNSPERLEYLRTIGQLPPEEKPPTLMDQLLPLAATAGTIYGAKAIGEQLPDWLSKGGTALDRSISNMSGATPTGVTEGAQAAVTQGAQQSAGLPFAPIGSNPGPIAPGFAAEGPDYMSGFSGPSPLSEPLPSNGLQTYGGNTPGVDSAAPGLLSQAPGTTLMGSETLGAALPSLGLLAGAYTGMQQLGGAKNALQGNKMSGMQQLALALPTFGASLLWNKIPGLSHKSTKERQANLTEGLLAKAPEDPTWVNYVNGMRNQTANPDAPYAGKYKTWDEYKAAGLEAGNLTGVGGNLKTFSPDKEENPSGIDWSKLNFEQQQKATQALINADQYYSKGGDVLVKDKEKARQIVAQALAAPVAPVGGLLAK